MFEWKIGRTKKEVIKDMIREVLQLDDSVWLMNSAGSPLLSISPWIQSIVYLDSSLSSSFLVVSTPLIGLQKPGPLRRPMLLLDVSATPPP